MKTDPPGLVLRAVRTRELLFRHKGMHLLSDAEPLTEEQTEVPLSCCGDFPSSRQDASPCGVRYHVTIRLRGPGGKVGSQGSGVERRRL